MNYEKGVYRKSYGVFKSDLSEWFFILFFLFHFNFGLVTLIGLPCFNNLIATKKAKITR